MASFKLPLFLDPNKFYWRIVADQSSVYNTICIAACLLFSKDESSNGMNVYYADKDLYIEYLNFCDVNKDKINQEQKNRYKL